jgi:hypothetical protein
MAVPFPLSACGAAYADALLGAGTLGNRVGGSSPQWARAPGGGWGRNPGIWNPAGLVTDTIRNHEINDPHAGSCCEPDSR